MLVGPGGGGVLTDPFYDAVAALPAPQGRTPRPGWDTGYERVDTTGTLITPNILVSNNERFRSQTHLWR